MKVVNIIAISILFSSVGSYDARGSCEASVIIEAAPHNTCPAKMQLQGCKITNIHLKGYRWEQQRQLYALRGMVAPIPKIFFDTTSLDFIRRFPPYGRGLTVALNVTRAEIYFKNERHVDSWRPSLEKDLRKLALMNGIPLLTFAFFKRPEERAKLFNAFAFSVGGPAAIMYGLSKIPYSSAIDWSLCRTALKAIPILPMMMATVLTLGSSHLLIPLIATFYLWYSVIQMVLEDVPTGKLICFDDSKELNREISRAVFSDSYEKNEYHGSKLSGFCQRVFEEGGIDVPSGK